MAQPPPNSSTQPKRSQEETNTSSNSNSEEEHSSKRLKLKSDQFIKIIDQQNTTEEQGMVQTNSSEPEGAQSEWKTVRHQKRTLENNSNPEGLSKSKLKKQEKLSLKKNIQLFPAEFHFDTRGFRHGKMVQLKDVRDLVLSILADERNQEWMLVKNKSNIKKMVVLMIPGLTTESLGISKPENSIMPFGLASQDSRLPIIQSLFSHACPTKAGGDRLRMFSCLSVFLTCQLSAMAKVKRDEERRKNSKNISSIDPTTYLMSPEQLVEHDYPSLQYQVPISIAERPKTREQVISNSESLPSAPPPPPFEAWLTHPQAGFIQTPMYPDRSTGGRPFKILGIDCEMCVTASGSELTRCTIVDWEEKLVYDQLVLPDSPITDYLTRFSGITEDRLKGTTTRLIDVQRKLSELIDFDTILVGHSIDCDLKAIKLAHPWLIDTSLIYQHPRGLPMRPSLKWLASKWLGKQIQLNNHQNGGHDSEEDARTALQLLKKKLEKGFGFGEFSSDTESIFERISRVDPAKRSAFVDFGSPSASICIPRPPVDPAKSLPPPAPAPNKSSGWKHADCFTFGSDKQVADGIISALDDHDFVFGRFMELSHAVGWSQPYGSRRSNLPEEKKEVNGKREDDGCSSASSSSSEEEEADSKETKAYESLNETLKKLSERLPKGTGLIVFNGHSDPRPMAELSGRKSRFEKAMMGRNRAHEPQTSRSSNRWGPPTPSLASTLQAITNQQLPLDPAAAENPDKISPELPDDLKAPAWSAQDDRDLADAVEKCKIGMSLFRIQ